MKVILRTDLDNVGQARRHLRRRRRLRPQLPPAQAAWRSWPPTARWRRRRPCAGPAICATRRTGRRPRRSPARSCPRSSRSRRRPAPTAACSARSPLPTSSRPCEAQTGIALDRRQLHLDEPIKIAGHALGAGEAAQRRASSRSTVEVVDWAAPRRPHPVDRCLDRLASTRPVRRVRAVPDAHSDGPRSPGFHSVAPSSDPQPVREGGSHGGAEPRARRRADSARAWPRTTCRPRSRCSARCCCHERRYGRRRARASARPTSTSQRTSTSSTPSASWPAAAPVDDGHRRRRVAPRRPPRRGRWFGGAARAAELDAGDPQRRPLRQDRPGHGDAAPVDLRGRRDRRARLQEPDDVTKALDEAETKVFEIAEERVVDSTRPLDELLSVAMDRLQETFDRGTTITGVATGYTDLDELLSGLQPSTLNIVGARPAMGKCVAWDTDARRVDR